MRDFISNTLLEKIPMARRSPFALAVIACGGLVLASCNMMGSSSKNTATSAARGVPFGAALSGRDEVPPANSRFATGEVQVSYDQASKSITWKVTFGGLTSAATAAHLHGPAAPGANAGVVVTLTPRNMFPIVSPLEGSATLTDEQAADLMAGKWYANIHTASNPNGEIRGQLLPK
jgi:CHRD domain